MNIYIDESGSINNKISSRLPYFVIALIYVKDRKKLQRAYKRFVSSNLYCLKELDQDKTNSNGKIVRHGGKMFDGDRFKELKGTQFDPAMKRKFLEFFSRQPYFEVFYIRINNTRITDRFCANTARCFNYTLRLALHYFVKNGLLPNEECVLQLDERNEKPEAKFFLENYLNTELSCSGECNRPFSVSYFDSAENHMVQIADVFSNVYFSQLISGEYSDLFKKLEDNKIIRFVFDFPPLNEPIEY